MKRKLWIFSLLIGILCLCGCESSEKDRDKILAALKKDKIISNSMEQIDIESYSFWPMEWCETQNYYIYKDKDSKMIAIRYQKNNNSKEDGYNHLVTIYYDVTINDDVNRISSEDATCENGYYKYENGEYTDEGKYQWKSSTDYHAIEKSSFFKGKYYSIELADS